MTGVEVQANWFSPFHFFAYLFMILAIMIGFYQWQWAKKVEKFVKVIIVKPDGSSETAYAPKTGSSVTITNPDTKLTKLWPISEITTIEMLYPGDGFIPVFLQKKIRTTIVDDGEWEPLLNRSSYSEKVASPDVKNSLRNIAETITDKNAKAQLLEMAEVLKIAPTREMVASPAVLGNLMQEKITELAVTVAKDIINPINDAIKRLGQRLNPMVIYIGGGLILILLVFAVYQISEIANSLESIEAIKQALGVK